MARDRVLAVVLAGGSGSRMDVLTRARAKPALPFGGSYRLIDFPLSNLHHSGIEDVWISVQYRVSSLDDEVANGRPWDLDRTRGGLRLLPPQQGRGSAEDGFASGNADVLFRNRELIQAFDPAVVVVLSADHVYRFDYTDAITTHRDLGADCTVVTTVLPRENASDHGVVRVRKGGRVTGFAYKPERPRSGTVATEIFVYRPDALFDSLEALHAELREGDDLGDFGEHLVPRLVENGLVVEHRLPGYWKDVGTPDRYLEAHRDLLAGRIAPLDDPAWPILTRDLQRAPARIHAGGRVEDGLVSPGSSIQGTVRRSVIGPGVSVERDAVVTDSIVFSDSVVRAGARVSGAIVDSEVEIGPDASIGARLAGTKLDEKKITILGRRARVACGARIDRGARLEPDSDG